MATLKDYEIMAGYDEKSAPAPTPAPAEATPPAPAKEPAPMEPEFNPDKEISAISQKYFKELDSTSGLNERSRMRLEQGFLANLGAVKAQRAKLENEKQTSMMNDLRMKEMQGNLNEQRYKFQQAQNIAKRQAGLAEQVKGVMFNPELNPDQQRDYVNALRIQNAAAISSDPATKSIFDTTIEMLPKKKYPQDMSDTLQMQVGEALANANPDEQVAISKLSDDPVALGYYLQVQKSRKAQADKDEEKREAARKEERTVALDLIKKTPKFMDEDERDKNKVDPSDTNPYLTSESQTTLQSIVTMTRGAKGLQEYMDAPDDRTRYEIGLKAQTELMKDLLEKQDNPKSSDNKAKADKLVPKVK